MVKESNGDTPVLQVANLSVSYSGALAPVLTDLNFEVWPGECIGIIGESGSGKTTLAKAILSSLNSAAIISGSIKYSPKRPSYLTEKNTKFRKGSDISLLAQEPWSSLNPAMSIKAQFREAILAHHPDLIRSEIGEKTRASLRAVGLDVDDEKLKQYPKEFSGGQQQRICVSLSLLHEPKLLIADEPTSSLDKAASDEILNLLFEKQSLIGNAMLLISHNGQEVFSRCSKVYQLTNGKLTQVQKPNAIESTPTLKRQRPAGRQLVLAKSLSFSRIESNKPHVIFEDINFELRKGQRLGISGSSGAGKSTLARVLTGLERPSNGALMVLGRDLFTQTLGREDRAKLALVFQDSSLSLNPRMTIAQILLDPLSSHQVRLTKSERRSRVLKALADVGLNSSLADSFPRFLSGGQRQRVNIARSLMLEPELLIADEPASALDDENTHRIMNLLDSLQAANGFGLLLISHDRWLLDQYTDGVLDINSPVRGNLRMQ